MNAIIIEDEPLAAGALENILREIAPDIQILAVLGSVGEGVSWLQQHTADIIFSDIHLGDGQSFDIFRRVKIKAPVIFITAYDEYALQAFKNQGVDYILKPFDPVDIRKALEKVRAFACPATVQTVKVADATNFQERFLVHIGAKIKSVQAEDIAYFMADGKYLWLYTFDGSGYIVDQTISGIEERLHSGRFFRINRKFIVSFKAIKEMIKYSNSRIRIVLSPLPPENIESIVSADRIREFKAWLDK